MDNCLQGALRRYPRRPAITIASAGAGHRALQLRLAHLRAPCNAEPASLGLELLAGRRVAAPDRGGLLAERAPGALREVLERLLAARARLGLLDIGPRRLTL